MWNNTSQRILLYLFLVSIFITVIAYQYWKQWVVLAIVMGMWWLCDVMYFEDGMFLYELNYDFWREENDTEW